MNNTNEHIASFLKYYFELESSPGYAVLLKGKWGTGKTWFLKEALKPFDAEKEKKYLYVSLYGVTSFDQIEDELFRQLHPVLSSKGMAIAGKLAKGLLKGTLKLDLNNDGKSDGSATIQVPDIKLPEYFNNTDGLILVFDDLERASIELSSLLGYINYFVEHQGYKVILVANEDELLKEPDSSKTQPEYRRIKEKLIGKTFEVQAQVDTALDNFLSHMSNPFSLQIFRENIALIKEYYILSGHKNLRHLKQSLWDFERFSTYLNPDVKQNKELIKNLLRVYLVLSFEIKSGSILATDISLFEKLNFDQLYLDNQDTSNKNSYQKIFNKYTDFIYEDMLLEDSIWVDILDKGIISLEKIQISLMNSKYFLTEEKPDWIQLWYFFYLSDVDFDKLLASVSASFFAKEYKEIGIVKHVAGMFLAFSDINLLTHTHTRQDILNFTKSYIDYLSDNNMSLESEDDDIFSRTQSWAGLAFYEKGTQDFIEICEYIELKIEHQILNQYPLVAKELLEDIVSDANSFQQKIHSTNSKSKFRNHPVLSYIDPAEFVNSLLSISLENRRAVVLALSSRYKNLGLNDDLLPEQGWLQEVIVILESEAAKRIGKISAYQIEKIISAYFSPAIVSFNKLNLELKRLEELEESR